MHFLRQRMKLQIFKDKKREREKTIFLITENSIRISDKKFDDCAVLEYNNITGVINMKKGDWI